MGPFGEFTNVEGVYWKWQKDVHRKEKEMEQQAFSGNEKMLKGCLHCHTTRSDGNVTPEDVISLYHQSGYDFLAITDHRYYNFNNFAPNVPITIIPGMEFDNTLEERNGFRCFHTVCIGPDKENGNGLEHDQKMPWFDIKKCEEYQTFLDDMHAKNNLTILCHPQWSSTTPRHFEMQQGNCALEIWNSVSALCCDCDNDAAYWDDLLGQGKVWYGVASDDAHSKNIIGNGWVMVQADKDINSILNALKNGEFYSSCGPEIYDFYVDGNTAVIDCSPVSRVRLHGDKHPNLVKRDNNGNITHAEFNIEGPSWAGAYSYVRISIVDKDGKKAWTNPIFL